MSGLRAAPMSAGKAVRNESEAFLHPLVERRLSLGAAGRLLPIVRFPAIEFHHISIDPCRPIS